MYLCFSSLRSFSFWKLACSNSLLSFLASLFSDRFWSNFACRSVEVASVLHLARFAGKCPADRISRAGRWAFRSLRGKDSGAMDVQTAGSAKKHSIGLADLSNGAKAHRIIARHCSIDQCHWDTESGSAENSKFKGFARKWRQKFKFKSRYENFNTWKPEN